MKTAGRFLLAAVFAVMAAMAQKTTPAKETGAPKATGPERPAEPAKPPVGPAEPPPPATITDAERIRLYESRNVVLMLERDSARAQVESYRLRDSAAEQSAAYNEIVRELQSKYVKSGLTVYPDGSLKPAPKQQPQPIGAPPQ